MQCIMPTANVAFVIEDGGVCHCFSYGSEIAIIRNNQYEELHGKSKEEEKLFYSRTSNKHKSMFRAHFGLN